MTLSRRNPVLLIATLSVLYSGTSVAYNYHLNDSLSSGSQCDENTLFPEPPCCGISNKPTNRIYGGTKVELKEFPWVVIIYIDKTLKVFGGGSLINSRWVLTAGHNVAEHSVEEVHLGEWNRRISSLNVKKFHVEKVVVHESYTVKNVLPENDIALLYLAESVTFTDYIKPICLPLKTSEQQNYPNKMAIVAGWGKTENGIPSEVLLKASVKVWDALKCQQHARNIKNKICAGGVEGIGACTGDSGGPLMLQLENNGYAAFYEIGLVSYGRCGKSGDPTVYASVSAYIKWITDTILKHQ